MPVAIQSADLTATRRYITTGPNNERSSKNERSRTTEVHPPHLSPRDASPPPRQDPPPLRLQGGLHAQPHRSPHHLPVRKLRPGSRRRRRRIRHPRRRNPLLQRKDRQPQPARSLRLQLASSHPDRLPRRDPTHRIRPQSFRRRRPYHAPHLTPTPKPGVLLFVIPQGFAVAVACSLD